MKFDFFHSFHFIRIIWLDAAVFRPYILVFLGFAFPSACTCSIFLFFLSFASVFIYYYSGVFCWKIQQFQINFAAQCSYYCIIHLNMNNANVVVCSLYTYIQATAIIIVIIIYLAFSFRCHWWVYNIGCAVHGCLRKIIKKTHESTHTLTEKERNCTRCRLLHLHASWPCKMLHHTFNPHRASLWLWLARSFWQSWYYYEGRNLTVATHEAHNASRLLTINYIKSLEKLFQLKKPMLKTSRLNDKFLPANKMLVMTHNCVARSYLVVGEMKTTKKFLCGLISLENDNLWMQWKYLPSI